MIYTKEISKDTFDGAWPFKVEKGTIINNSNCIMFKCLVKIFGKPIERTYAVNGNAINLKNYFGAKELDKKVMLSTNKLSVNDVIMFGLKLNPDYE